jgi:hypothetical protein
MCNEKNGDEHHQIWVVVSYWQPQIFTGWFKEQTMLVIFSWTPHFPHCSWLKWVHGTIYGKFLLSLNTKIAGNWMFITQKCCGTEPPNMKNDYSPKIGGCLCQRALLGLWFRVEQRKLILVKKKKQSKTESPKKQRQEESPEKTNKEQKKSKPACSCIFLNLCLFFFVLSGFVFLYLLCFCQTLYSLCCWTQNVREFTPFLWKQVWESETACNQQIGMYQMGKHSNLICPSSMLKLSMWGYILSARIGSKRCANLFLMDLDGKFHHLSHHTWY